MPLKNKTMALIRLRKTPYSGLLSFLQDVFYKKDELAGSALKFLRRVYEGEVKASDWKKVIRELFGVEELSESDEQVIDQAVVKHLGFHRQNLKASKYRLRGKKVYKKLLEKDGVSEEVRVVLKKVTDWNSAVTSYYSILNKLKALGLIEKSEGFYVKSEKFKRRFSQVLSLVEGFENEVTQQ